MPSLKTAWTLKTIDGHLSVVENNPGYQGLVATVEVPAEGPLLAMAPTLRGTLAGILGAFERLAPISDDDVKLIADARRVLSASHPETMFFDTVATGSSNSPLP